MEALVSESQNELVSAALVAAQGEMEPAIFDSVNPFLKNKYASLGAIIQQSRPVLAKHGLAILQELNSTNGSVSVTTTIVHTSGQRLSGGTLSLPLGDEKGKSLAQVAGSLCTYLKRYAWASVCGLYAEEDTDGNATEQRPKGAIPRQKSTGQAAGFNSPPNTEHVKRLDPNDPRAVDVARMRALKNMLGAPGQANEAHVHDWLVWKGWIVSTQQTIDWPTEHVPLTKEAFDVLYREVQDFKRDDLPFK
jgi:ERF superfamily